MGALEPVGLNPTAAAAAATAAAIPALTIAIHILTSRSRPRVGPREKIRPIGIIAAIALFALAATLAPDPRKPILTVFCLGVAINDVTVFIAIIPDAVLMETISDGVINSFL